MEIGFFLFLMMPLTSIFMWKKEKYALAILAWLTPAGAWLTWLLYAKEVRDAWD